MAEYPLGAEAIKSQFKRAGVHPLSNATMTPSRA